MVSPVNIFHYDEVGMRKILDQAGWMVGIKNWKPENDIHQITNLERHLLTDEVFTLLDGKGVLLTARQEENTEYVFSHIEMEKGKVYAIPAGVWHNTITFPDTKMLLVENSGTGIDNSEFIELPQEISGYIKNYLSSLLIVA